MGELQTIAQHSEEIRRLKEQINAPKSVDAVEAVVEKAVAARIGNGGAQDGGLGAKIDLITKDIEKIKAIQTAQNFPRSSSAEGARPGPSAQDDEERRYWWARRTLRAWPVPGTTQREIWKNTGLFLEQKLGIDKGVIAEADVQDIRRLHQSRAAGPHGREKLLMKC